MDVHPRKVTARLDIKAGSAFARPQPRSRPGSPTKHSPTSSLAPSPLRPKAKVNSTATVRKLSSSSSLSTSRTNNVSAPSLSRPASPLKPSWMMTNGAQPSRPPRPRITARPTSRAGMSSVQANPSPSTLEPRQRALTAASAQLKLPHPEDRPRSGSVIALHHTLSIPDLDSSSSQTPSYPSPSAETPLVDVRRTNAPPALVKIRSKVSGLIRPAPTSADGPASRSLSPPYATTRPIHVRARTPSITTTFSLNDPVPSTFYPITTASPAANPHRFVPRRAPSPARPFSSPTLVSEPHPPRKSPLAPRVDPASVPLPPHSPPISALSLSSKSSVSRTSVSLNSDRAPDHQVLNLVSHLRSMERVGQTSPFLPNAETLPNTRRDRSRSKERSPRDLVHRGDSDLESDGSERQLRAEAKTNRKIADLEITNRSLLAINASLETTKNRQAKEIRDLRRKLRESRLILPPRTYKAVKSASSEEGHDRDDDDYDDDDEDEDESDAENEDETFRRVRGLIDGLVESGKKALETRPEDFRASLATKVLNADELRSWRGSGQRASMRNSLVDKQDADDETIHSSLSTAFAGVPNSGHTSSGDSDGEPPSDSPRSSSLPPITITHSL